MAVDFKALLSKPLDAVKRPPAFPVGTYKGVIKQYKFQESRFENRDTKEKEAQVAFTLKVTEPGDDVANLGPEAMDGIDIASRTLTAELPLSGGNEWVTKGMLEALGITPAGRSFADTIPETLGAAVMFEVTQRMGKGNTEGLVFNDVRAMRAAQ